MRVAIIISRYYSHIAAMLERGALEVLQKSGYEFEVIEVPGALEIPAAIAWASASKKTDGFVALGCVIRGATSHSDHICDAMTAALMDLSVYNHIAIGNGVLTVENEKQALERADPNLRNKGGDAAHACLAMMKLAAQYQMGEI